MNENYGPAAKQIFDLAHRRFPFAYRMPSEGKTRFEIKAELAAFLQSAVRQMFPLGRKAEGSAIDRVPEIRSKFETQVRKGLFHGLVRRKGAITIAVIPAAGKKYESHVLHEQNLPPPGQAGWNPEIRGHSVLSVSTHDNDRCAITAIHDDGVILGADTWVFDPVYHPMKELIVPTAATESAIITAVASYLKALRSMEAALPWHICVSLLEIKDYWLFVSNSETSRRPYSEVDIAPDPVVVRSVSDTDSPLAVARLLRPVIDFIWRECGLDGSWNYTDSGDYTRRLCPW